jgi:hypothetical protein
LGDRKGKKKEKKKRIEEHVIFKKKQHQEPKDKKEIPAQHPVCSPSSLPFPRQRLLTQQGTHGLRRKRENKKGRRVSILRQTPKQAAPKVTNHASLPPQI